MSHVPSTNPHFVNDFRIPEKPSPPALCPSLTIPFSCKLLWCSTGNYAVTGAQEQLSQLPASPPEPDHLPRPPSPASWSSPTPTNPTTSGSILSSPRAQGHVILFSSHTQTIQKHLSQWTELQQCTSNSTPIQAHCELGRYSWLPVYYIVSWTMQSR